MAHAKQKISLSPHIRQSDPLDLDSKYSIEYNLPLYAIKPLPEFHAWFDRVKNPATRTKGLAHALRNNEKAPS